MPATKPTDIRIIGTEVFFLPITLRVPLKFGPETVSSVVCLRARVTVMDRRGNTATGWGETPLSVSWVWPSKLSVAERARRMEAFSLRLGEALAGHAAMGHPMEIGWDFVEGPLAELTRTVNAEAAAGTASAHTGETPMPLSADGEPMPYLASLVAFSAFDIAVHDAFGQLLARDVYQTYTGEFMSRDLAGFLQAEQGSGMDFRGRFPADFFVKSPPKKLPVWHLVGGVDALEKSDLTGSEPQDGYPVLLGDWIQQDGLRCLKVKLRGTDSPWDYERMVRVARIGFAKGVRWLSADFNCTVSDPAYVNEILDRLLADEPEVYARTLYVEQPFPYDLEAHRIDVRSVSARKPLFLDESAHDWHFVRLGRQLGWSGVALKTCKTQTGALLSLCWAKAHGMPLMVQDLTNPMLAMIPHVRLAAHAGTIQGVECNAMQFYPAASETEERVHPGLFRRRGGELDLSSIAGPGFGYRAAEIGRKLPPAGGAYGRT